MKMLSISLTMVLAMAGCSKKEKPGDDLEKRPLLEGLAELKFGTGMDEIKSNPDLGKRCLGEMRFSKAEPRSPGQTVEEWAGYCVAEVAGRHAQMGVHFDHKKQLHLIFFMFGRSPSDERVERLATEEERQAFAKAVRALLGPELGEPRDRSGESSKKSAIALSWYGKTGDVPPHATEVNLELDEESQTLTWEDTTRYQELEAALERERSAKEKKQGI